VIISGKGGNTEKRAAVPVIFFDKRIDLAVQMTPQSQLKMCHGLALMGHQNLLEHHETNHWSHGCDMKLIGSNRYGVMTANNVSFGSGLRPCSSELFDTSQLKKMCHGLALIMGHQNLLGHLHTNHWSHGCDIKLIGSNSYGVMTANNVSFGSGLGHELNF
jgi:hypothetical protein